MFITPQHQQLLEHIERYTGESTSPTKKSPKNVKSKSRSVSPRRVPIPIPSLIHKMERMDAEENFEDFPLAENSVYSKFGTSPAGSTSNSTSTSPRSETTSPRTFEGLLESEDSNELLCKLLEKRKYTAAQINTLLRKGASINYQSQETKSTAVMIACGSVGRKGVNASILKLLLSGTERCNFDACDSRRLTALHYAAKFNNAACVLELLDGGANVNVCGGSHGKTTPLHLAVAHDHLETARHLLAYGADPNMLDCTGQCALELAITAKASEELIDELVRRSSTRTLLQKCMDNCRVQKYRNIIAKLAGKGVEMRVRTAKNKTPLMYAASLGDAQLIRVLCKVPSHLIEGVNARDGNFHTALHSACCWGHAECVQVLVDHGADLHATDNNGNTPLHRYPPSKSNFPIFLEARDLIFVFAGLQCGTELTSSNFCSLMEQTPTSAAPLASFLLSSPTARE